MRNHYSITFSSIFARTSSWWWKAQSADAHPTGRIPAYCDSIRITAEKLDVPKNFYRFQTFFLNLPINPTQRFNHIRYRKIARYRLILGGEKSYDLKTNNLSWSLPKITKRSKSIIDGDHYHWTTVNQGFINCRRQLSVPVYPTASMDPKVNGQFAFGSHILKFFVCCENV